MGKAFKQLTKEDRIAIAHLLRAGIGKDKIAKQLGHHRSTIYREIARNSTRQGYFPFLAELKVARRKKRTFKLNRDALLRHFVLRSLQEGWSPGAISGRLKMETDGHKTISPETIYSYIYSDYGIRNKYYKYLRHERTWRYPKISRKKRLRIPNRTSIKEREERANKRLEAGHWECDLMHFSRGNSVNLITLRERKSRYMVAVKNPSKEANTTASNIISRLKKITHVLMKSMTFDNGSEFSCHEKIAKGLNIKTYFCDPYKSYQKGSIENGNKELRKWFPRNCISEMVKPRKIKKHVRSLNLRPMRVLGYKTPSEVLFGKQINFVPLNLKK